MIKQLRLENFKCFQDETIQLSNLTLLAGLNGMGKSSVIQALLLLRQSYDSLLLQQKKLGLNGDYTEVGTSSDLLYTYFDKREIGITLETDADQQFRWRWTAENDFDILDEIDSSAGGPLEELSLFSNNFHYLSAERVGPRAFYTTSTAKVIHENQLGINGELAANYFAYNKEQKVIVPGFKREATEGQSLYEQVNAWLHIIRPGTKVVVKESPDAGIVTLNFEFVQGKDNPRSYKANNVGFGLTYIFPLIVAVISSQPGTLLLLENPEAHIHPKGQAELGILLATAAAAGIQIIVETHSDHILNGIRYAVKNGILNKDQCRLLFFSGKVIKDRFKHYVEHIKVTADGKLSRRPEDFFDVWENMLLKLV